MPLEQPVMSATGLFMGTCPCSICCWISALELGADLVCPVLQISCAVATAQGRCRVAALPPAVGWQYVVEQIGSATGFAGQQIEAVSGLACAQLPAHSGHGAGAAVVYLDPQRPAELAVLG